MRIVDVEYEKIDETMDKLIDEEEMGWEEHAIWQDEKPTSDVIVVYGPAFRVTDRNLIFMDGTYCTFNEKEGVAEPDFSCTVIYSDVPDEEFDPDRWIYFEQDPPMTAIHNFVYAREHTGFASA